MMQVVDYTKQARQHKKKMKTDEGLLQILSLTFSSTFSNWCCVCSVRSEEEAACLTWIARVP